MKTALLITMMMFAMMSFAYAQMDDAPYQYGEDMACVNGSGNCTTAMNQTMTQAQAQIGGMTGLAIAPQAKNMFQKAWEWVKAFRFEWNFKWGNSQ